MKYWLLKSEPSVYAIADLEREGRTCWDGIRNYQARNFIRDRMQVGDRVLFYHSNAEPPAVVGIAEVCRAAYPDHTAFDPTDPHYDAASTPEKPIWLMVDIAYVATLPAPVALDTLRQDPVLEGILVAKKGQRLSVQPVSEEHYLHICLLGGLSQDVISSPP
jgi:predicted RNA-binding protein with PUA-like domain